MGTSNNSEATTNVKDHWNKVYTNKPIEKLGWFETDLSPMLQLINQTQLSKNASLLNIGAGSTTLVDELVTNNYTNIIATDISEVALKSLTSRVGSNNITTIVDDLTNPKLITDIEPVDLWIDRAVLHFFTKPEERNTYFKLLSKTVKSNGYAIIAQFNTSSSKFCSGLPVFQYNESLLKERLGANFELLESFNYTYTMPSGDTREYIYTLFKKN